MTLPMQPSPRVAALLDKMRRSRGRLIFALDATGSREPTWDMAAQLQAQMFEEAARIGGLDVQLRLLPRRRRGPAIVRGSPMPHELVSRMGTIRCMAGATKIARVLRHIRAENEREKIAAAIFIGDAVEEHPRELYDAAADLGVPVFMFQEGNGEVIYLNQRGERRRAAEGRAGVSRDRAAVRRRLRQVRCRRRKAARRIAARGRRVCGRWNYCARRPAHRQRAQAARSNEVMSTMRPEQHRPCTRTHGADKIITINGVGNPATSYCLDADAAHTSTEDQALGLLRSRQARMPSAIGLRRAREHT